MIDLEPMLAEATRSAVHLEMRDDCRPSDEPMFSQWLEGRPVAEIAEAYAGTARHAHVSRGVRFRRARIVSEPVTQYIRFLHAVAADANIAAGEEVRWLPRRLASGLCLPGNDFWLMDDRVVRFGHFSGEGLILGHEVSTEPSVAKLCAEAFEGVWDRAISHHEFTPA